MSDERKVVRCAGCDLRQFFTKSGKCRRCGKMLHSGVVKGTTVIYLAPDGEPRGSVEVLPMRTVMQLAAAHAVQYFGKTTAASRALRIPHERLKQLLREGGDTRNYRYKLSRVRAAGQTEIGLEG
jgi:hypothetical protein